MQVDMAAIQHLTVAGLVVIGTFFLAVGTFGLLRLPNVYNRMQATSKPPTLGVTSLFLAGFVQFGPGNAGLTSLVGILFLFLTVPTGAHMISRAAQKSGVPFLEGVTWPGDGDNITLGESNDTVRNEEDEEEAASDDSA